MAASYNWNPFEENTNQQPSRKCLYRLKRDLESLARIPPVGISATSEEEDICNVHVVIEGPAGTPYEKGFFYFFLKVPPNYPFSPPRVKLMTTDAGVVRFGPNLYSNGKVCLSILGTWVGPSWSPANTLESLLISIQALLCEEPLLNEPGFNKDDVAKMGETYNDRIRHETMRVAVVGMLRNDCCLGIPPMLTLTMQQKFLENYAFYHAVCEQNHHKDGCIMKDPFMQWKMSEKFQYNSLKSKLLQVHSSLNSGNSN